MMDFTVAVCTRNRAGVLPRALDSILAQDAGSLEAEALVVDNASTDDTARVARGYANKNSLVRLVREPEPGLSHARNRAVKEARGRLVVFLDDDAAMEPGYLRALARFLKDQPDLGACGGPVRLGWDGPKPPWLEPGMTGYLNALDWGPGRCELRFPGTLFGTNLVLPKKVMQDLGGFSPDLGRRRGGLWDSEEAELLVRVQKAGLPIWYDPQLRVTHYFTPERISEGFLMEKAWWHGRSRYKMERMHPGFFRPWAPAGALALSLGRTALGRGKGELTERLFRKTSRGYFFQMFRGG